MSERGVPQNNSAEESLLGAILLRPIILGDLRDTLDPSDFYRAQFQNIYAAMLALYAVGSPIDPVTVAAELNDREVGPQFLQALTTNTPSTSAYRRYADLVIDASRRRRSINFWSEMIDDAYQVGNDFDAVLARSDASSDRLIAPRSVEIEGLTSIADTMKIATDIDNTRPWLIPNVVKALWRIVLVAGEGWGKAVLMRFLALHAAAGRNPWHPREFITPRNVLYVDCENSMSSIAHQVRISNTMLMPEAMPSIIEEANERFHIWHREGGLNLRERRPQAQFEAVIQRTEPEIVFMGPLYKLFRRTSKEDQEQVAIEFTNYIDELRNRYGFAIMFEHHAPKGNAGHRDMIPFGSSQWMRWPEFGITMEPKGNVTSDDEQYTMELGRFRRDREVADWPQEITRGAMGAQTAWSPFWKFGECQKLIDNDVPHDPR